MHTVLVLHQDRTVSAVFPEGPSGLPCFRALHRSAPCPNCPLDHLTESRPQQTMIRTEDTRRFAHTLRLVPGTGQQPDHVIETITPLSDTALLAPQEIYDQLYPLYRYAIAQRHPLSVIIVRYRHTIPEAQLLDLKTRFPRRFRTGSLVGELPGRSLIWVSPHLTEYALGRLAVRIRRDFPDPVAYTVQAWHGIPPTPKTLSPIDVIKTFSDWLHQHQRQSATALQAPPLSIPEPSPTIPSSTPVSSDSSSDAEPLHSTPTPPLRQPLTKLDAILQHLEQAGPTLRMAVDQVRALRAHHADADALLFAELLQPFCPPPPTHGIAHTATIRDAVQLMDVFAKEAGRLLLDLCNSGVLATHGYHTIGEFAQSIGLHPETAATLMHLAAQRRPLIQISYPDRLPSRPKPKPLGLILQQDRRQQERRAVSRTIPHLDQRQRDRRRSPDSHRSTLPPSREASA